MFRAGFAVAFQNLLLPKQPSIPSSEESYRHAKGRISGSCIASD